MALYQSDPWLEAISPVERPRESERKNRASFERRPNPFFGTGRESLLRVSQMWQKLANCSRHPSVPQTRRGKAKYHQSYGIAPIHSNLIQVCHSLWND
jgi:hypothetical protein